MTRVVFDNTDLSQFGYTFHKDIDEVPEHDYEEVTILGKNGTLLIDNKRMKNVPESYDIAITDNSTADLDRLRNFLASKVGFKRLEDDIRPDRFVMARFNGLNSRLPSDRSKATATINFERKPERWLKSGEEAVPSSSEDATYTGNPATIDNPSGLSAVSSLAVALNPVQDFNGYEYPWIGGAGKNLCDFDETVSAIKDTPPVLLSSGTYYVYVAAESTQYNSYLQFSTDGTSYTSASTDTTPVSVNVAMNYGNKKCTVTVSESAYVRVKIQTNASITDKRVRVMITKDSTNYTSIPANFVSGNESFEAIWSPYENICPIYPANGKNMFDPSTLLSGYYADKDTDTLSGSTTNYRTAELALYQGTYTISFSNTVNIVRYREKGIVSNNNVATGVKSYTFTVSTNATVALGFRIPDVAWDDSTTIQIERGSVATSYVPYQGIMVNVKGRNLYPIAIGADIFTNNVGGSHSNDNGTLVVTTGTGTSSGVYSRGTSTLRNISATYIGAITYSFKVKTSSAVTVQIGYQGGGAKNVNATTDWQTVTISTTSTGAMAFIVYTNGTAATIYVKDFMFEVGSEAHDYEPYSGNTYYMQIGQTVYGGTVDLATGVLTVDKAVVTLNGSETWGKGSTNQGFYTSAHTMLKANDYTSVILCDKLKTYERMNKNDYYKATNGITGYIDGSSQYPTQNWIYAKGGGATTSAEFKTWLASNPLQVVYELATPQTIQLTPQQISLLTGINYISSSDEVTLVVTEPSLLENPTLFESKPLIRVYGNGTLVINHQYITISENPYEYIDIDCELMDCYYQSNNANQYVSFSTNDHVTLKSGNNYIAYDGTCEITPRWYEV